MRMATRERQRRVSASPEAAEPEREFPSPSERKSQSCKESWKQAEQNIETLSELRTDIELHLWLGNTLVEKELIIAVPVRCTRQQDLLVSSIVSQLKDRSYDIEEAIVSFYSPSEELFIYCGQDPISEDCVIPWSAYGNKGRVILKVKHVDKQGLPETSASVCGEPFEREEKQAKEEQEQEQEEEQEEAPKQQQQQKRRTGRTKERVIREVIEKVAQWRQLYRKQDKSLNDSTALSLAEAADRVGVPKKSLDDYLLQLRMAKKNNFDFRKHQNDRIGVLRAFNKACRNGTSTGSKQPLHSDSSIPPHLLHNN